MSVLFFLIDETDVYVCAFLQKKKDNKILLLDFHFWEIYSF